MSTPMQRYEEESAIEAQTHHQAGVAEYAVILEAMSLAESRPDDGTFAKLRELIQTMRQLRDEHSKQLRRTTLALNQYLGLEAVKSEVANVH